jgi:N-acetylglucosaminyldiphosphoundecaprenol N-acetyl-beta-D-mannosaminyltransferase
MRNPPSLPVVLFGVPVHNLSAEEALDRVLRDAEERRPCHVVTSNLDFLRQSRHDPEMHRIHLDADLVLADGMPLIWLSRLFGAPLKERVAGSDLVPRLAERARAAGLSVFAVGGAPGVAERALGVLRERFPGLHVSGWASPPVAPLLRMETDEIRRSVSEKRPHIVFVALGTPKQEKWIRLHHGEAGMAVAVGIGGSLDFLAGTQTRAPRLFQRAGLEWLWRLLGSPRRLLGRYAGDFAFLSWMLLRTALVRLSPRGRAPAGGWPDDDRLARAGAIWTAFPRLKNAEEAAAFAADVETRRRGGPVVLDLSDAAWLDSLELGVLAHLARECRIDGGRLFLACVPPRARRLLRLFRMERFLEIADDGPSLERELGRLPDAAGVVRLRRAGPRLQVLLPREFAGPAVRRAREELMAVWREGGLKEVVIDAARTEYLDVAGARLLLAFQRLVERGGEGSVWILGISPPLLDRLKKEGHDLARVDRRKRFRIAEAVDPVAEARP